MLSLDFPNLMGVLKDAGPGLFPFRLSDGSLILAIKGTSDLAIAAKVTGVLKFHLFDIVIGGKAALGIITAAYDRQEAPATVQTVCSDPFNRDVVAAITQTSIRIGFFDMHNSEIFGGNWKITLEPPIPEFVNRDVPQSFGPTLPIEFYIDMAQRFRRMDDGYAVSAELLKADSPDNVNIVHMTEEFQNSRKLARHGVYQSALEVDDEFAAEYQETQIARQLASIYGQDRVFVGPSTDKRPEFCDVLAIGKNEVICVQAKAAVRNEQRALENDDRRKSRLTKNFKHAIKQALGSERAFYKSRENILFGNLSLQLSPKEKLLVHIVILTEKHPVLLDDWSKFIAEKNQNDATIIVIDQAEFDSLCTVQRTREKFMSAVLTIYEAYKSQNRIAEYLISKDRLAAY
jgi:hypothetical protein